MVIDRSCTEPVAALSFTTNQQTISTHISDICTIQPETDRTDRHQQCEFSPGKETAMEKPKRS